MMTFAAGWCADQRHALEYGKEHNDLAQTEEKKYAKEIIFGLRQVFEENDVMNESIHYIIFFKRFFILQRYLHWRCVVRQLLFNKK